MKPSPPPKCWRYFLYPVAVFWLIWLYMISNVFTMGYTSPIEKKVAIAVVGVLMPLLFAMTRTKDGWLIAIVLAGVTWLPIAMLLSH